MSKIVLSKPTAGYNLAAINDNFDKLEAEFQNKVLYRNNPTGEPNTVETDIDMNSNSLLNVDSINGVEVTTLNDLGAAITATEASAVAAAGSAAQAAASYDSFDDRYLGAKASNPTLDNDGNALLAGALYWNTTSTQMLSYTGSVWVPISVPGGVVPVASGGTGSTTASAARAALGAAASGANTDIASLYGVTSINGGQLAGLRNRIINGNFGVNQRGYVSGAAVGTGLYGHDRWRMAASGDTYTFSTTANVTTVTIPSGKVLQQVIEGLNLETGTYTLSWSGTAQGKIGAGSYGASGVTGAITGGTNTTIEFGPGTISKVQLELGSVATTFEQRPYGMELVLCQRYYWKSFTQGVAPAQGVGSVAGALLASTSATSTFGASTVFPVVMRASPSVTTFNPQSGSLNANWRDTNNSADRVVNSVAGGDAGISIIGNSGIVNGLNYIHATAVAEL